jgi:hypothetical protein
MNISEVFHSAYISYLLLLLVVVVAVKMVKILPFQKKGRFSVPAST